MLEEEIHHQIGVAVQPQLVLLAHFGQQADHFHTVIDAGRFDQGGVMELSIKHRVFVPFLAFTFESWIDHVEFVVR